MKRPAKRKVVARKRPAFRAKTRINLAKWALGDWVDHVAEALKVTEIARKIAEQAIEELFGDNGIYLTATPIGVEISSEDDTINPAITIPWDFVPCMSLADALALQKWANEQVAEFSEDEGES